MVARSWLNVCFATVGFVKNVYSYTAVPSPDIDLNGLGQVALGGNFDAIATYSYVGQTEGIRGNGTQSVLQRLPNGMYDVLAATDANIADICSFTTKNGTLLGVVVAGNFTSIAGIGAQSVAFIDGRTGNISPHPGIEGVVNAVLCDADTNTAYLGGAFDAADSTNAIAWLSTGSWANLPFAGFDAPVTSITKASNGHIVFGGSFTGLKNMTTSGRQRKEQINLAASVITSVANVTTGNNVLCPTNATSTPWELEDRTAGSWTASMRYGYEPSRLRLWNNPQGKGVRTWRFTALPNTGIMNLSYTDPVTGNKAYCDATCPLAQNTSLPYQDFDFVNRIGMNSFRIDVSDWYGQGGALKGIELFQNDTFIYAIQATSGPDCLKASNAVASVTTTGPWYTTPSGDSYADYLTAVTGPTTVDTTEVVFQPDINERGNYTIVVYTPGCRQDGSCGARGSVTVTGNMTADGKNPLRQELSQTNDYEKYEQVYQGPVDATSGSFRPAVTIRASGQRTDQLIVASRIRFSGNPSTGGLNGLFDYDPNVAVVDTDFSKSAINNVGTMLKPNAQINAFAVHADTVFSAGSFSDDTFENIMSFRDNQARSLPGNGLNAAVFTLYAANDVLYVGGNFTKTNTGNSQGLNNVAGYNYGNNSWVALGAGLNGPVTKIIPFQLNVTAGQVETVIGITGSFTAIQAVGDTSALPANGFAVWVPSRSQWLQNLGSSRALLAGQLSSYTTLPNSTWLAAGTLVNLGQVMRGTAGLRQSNNQINIQQLPIEIETSAADSSASGSKRALLTRQNITGIVAGTYDTNGGRNTTILAGHFSARTNSSQVRNLAFINGNNGQVTGLPSGIDDNSTFLTLAVRDNLLCAGGIISGQVEQTRVRGLVLYDLASSAYRSPQPAALDGGDGIVNAIAIQDSTSSIYVGGSFATTAQGLACPSVCMYDTSSNLWSSVGSGLSGPVTALHFIGNDQLLATGNLTVSGNATSLAVYSIRQQSWLVYGNSGLPGPISAFAKTSQAATFYVAGTTTSNGSAYLSRMENGNPQPIPVSNLLETGSSILGIQLLQLTRGHRSSPYLDNNNDLLILGQLNITGFGRASAALFNGTTMQPFLLSVDSAGNPGSLSTLFSSKMNPAEKPGGSFRHSLGLAVLVAFCAALGTIFLIILAGMILNRIQRKRAGYSTLPAVPYQDKNANINRVPPERLFASVRGDRAPGVPAV